MSQIRCGPFTGDPQRQLSVLIVNEASCLVTGFATIGREFLTRLGSREQWMLSELGCYARWDYGPGHPHRFQDQAYANAVPWNFYFSYPQGADHVLGEDIENQFGKAVFEEVCLECKPRIVFTIRDYWHDCYIERSPARRFFKWIWQLCIDSDPIPAHWLQSWSRLDAILTYSAYGKYVLETQSSLKVDGVARCGADLTIYAPHDQKGARRNLGIPEDAIVFGTVCRNQPRKRIARYFDAITYAFKQYGSQHGDMLRRCIFLLHTTHPDVGIDIPEFVDRTPCPDQIWFTYRCVNCGFVRASRYLGISLQCPNCGLPTLRFPSTSRGFRPEEMAMLFTSMDWYVQPSIAGAAEMPAIEAKCCGVPVLCPPAAAMAELVCTLDEYINERRSDVTNHAPDPSPEHYQAWDDCHRGGERIPIATFWWDESIGVKRHLFSHTALADLLIKCAQKTGTEYHRQAKLEARQAAEKFHDWSKTAKVWESVLSKVAEAMEGEPNPWFAPDPDMVSVPLPDEWKKYNTMNNQDFLDFCLRDVLRDPWRIGTAEYYKILGALEAGFGIFRPKGGICNLCQEKIYLADSYISQSQPFNREILWRQLIQACAMRNSFEARRLMLANAVSPSEGIPVTVG